VRRYRFERWWNLIVVRAAIEGEHDIQAVRLMVDTGSSQSMLPWHRVQEVGDDPAASRARRRIFTANSTIVAPQVTLRRFHCLGKVVENFPVLCHTLPFNTHVEGLLGLAFLRAFDISIHVRRGYIELE
jgi:predicted aspartyl protease